DEPPPWLECRSKLAGVDRQLSVQQGDSLDFFVFRKPGRVPVNLTLDQVNDPVIPQQLAVTFTLESFENRIASQHLDIGVYKCRGKLPPVPSHNDLGDEPAGHQQALDPLRSDVFPAAGLYQVLLAISDRKISIGINQADITRSKPAVLGERLGIE